MKLTDMDKLQKYFIHNIRDAEVKGINSKVALIEKIAYGLRTEGTWRQQYTLNAETWITIYGPRTKPGRTAFYIFEMSE